MMLGQRWVILGLARQGVALARFAASQGAQVVVSDMRPAQQLTEPMSALADLPIAYVLGGHPLTLLDGADRLAVSGGVPADLPIVLAAQIRNIPITNDSLVFAEHNPAKRTVGITGSAGKTTTTSLTGKMCQLSGTTTWVGGNIGNPLIANLEQIGTEDYVIQELSSFQLEFWNMSPPVATVLNITPNHLDRHKTMAAYTAAKANILRYQTGDGIAILNEEDAGSCALRSLVQGRLRWFSRQMPVSDGAYLQNNQLWLTDGQQKRLVCSMNDIRLRGQHNLANVLAAIVLADSVGVPVEVMRQAIIEFKGVAHRLELVRTVYGVQYVNDSIATAPERSLAALAAFEQPVILLAGGRDKEMVWETWVETVLHRVKAVILFGALAEMLESRLLAANGATSRYPIIIRESSMAEALQMAAQLAKVGDVVLLSPAGTSYDAFTDFAERGEKFRQLVEAL